MLKINNIKIKLNDKNYKHAISEALNEPKKNIHNVTLLRQSIDARRNQVYYNCAFSFTCENEDKLLKKYKNKVFPYVPYNYKYPSKTNKKVLVVGSGPAGLFCAYILSKNGSEVILIERGKDVDNRSKDVDILFNEGQLNKNSNIAFGEGGSGTFSDGKLTTGTKNPRISFVLDTFIKHGAPSEIKYEALPHIGTDKLRNVIKNMREEIIANGGKVYFETKFEDFYEENNKHYVKTTSLNKEKIFEVDDLVLAIGHSARDTYEMLNKKLILTQKPFAIGVRIEQLQEEINKIQYGKSYKLLKSAPYKLAVRTSLNRGVYTFCMCPGGVVVPSNEEEGLLCVNGMSYYARDKENANSAILVQVKEEDFKTDDPLEGINFQKEIERKAYILGGNNQKAPVQKALDYINNIETTTLGKITPSYKPGYTFANISEIFPSFINDNLKEGLALMNKKMPGFINEDTIITGVETRSSAPLRIERSQDMVSNVSWIYPIGEGAGYSGGIMSSAVDGILCAEKICDNQK